MTPYRDRPSEIELSITGRCNLRCAYCSHFSGSGDVPKDVPLEEWTRFMEELGRLSVGQATIGGGEPFLRDDLPAIIASAGVHGIAVALLSNGTLIDDETARELKSLGCVRSVQVSIDGSTEETHDAFRGKGSFRKAVAGLQSLQKHDIPVTVRVTIHRRNVHELERIGRFLLEDLGVPDFSTNAASHFGLCRYAADTVQLTLEDRMTAIEQSARLNERYGRSVTAAAGPLAELEMWWRMDYARDRGIGRLRGGGTLSGCGGPREKIAVRSDGIIVPCLQLSHMELGRINHDRIAHIWHRHPLMRKLRERVEIPLTDFPYCRDCDYVLYCTGNCPAIAYTTTGNVSEPSPDGCYRRFLEAGGTLPKETLRRVNPDPVEMPEYPLSRLYVYLTRGCNLRCRHCWMEPDSRDRDNGRSKVTAELFRSVIEEAEPLGLTAVKLTGGEPLIHPEIETILETVIDRNLVLNMETNGVVLTRPLAQKISLCRAPSVSVSLDAADEDIHEWMRGVKGSYRSAIRGIENLAAEGVSPQVVMSLGRRNRDQVEPMVRLAESLGAGSVKFNIIQPTLRGREMLENGETLSVRESIELGMWVERDLSASTSIDLYFDQPPAFRPLSAMFGTDSAGCGRCSVFEIVGLLADGSYALCGIGENVKELVFGRAGHDPLIEVWRDSPVLHEIRSSLPRKLRGVCSRCLMRELCLGSCIAQNFYATGDFRGPFWYCAEAYEQGLFPSSRLIDEPRPAVVSL